MNYKTTILGSLSAAASFVMFAQTAGYISVPHWLMGLALFAHAGGLAGLGIMAKDFDVTGGSIGATPEAEIRVAGQVAAKSFPGGTGA